jgi:hypothetical protein
MCILYFDREQAKVFRSALYVAALERRQELEIIAIAAANDYRKYNSAISALERAYGAYAIGNALDYLAEITPSYPAWR